MLIMSTSVSAQINSGNIILRNTQSINTENLEFSPSYYANGIVYATSRYKQGERDDNINETFFELFYAELGVDGMPMDPKEFSVELNSYLHEGPVTFDRTGQRMYFTRNNLKKGLRKADEQGVTRLKIYEAQKGPFDWIDIKELPFNSDEFSCAHPTLTADGKKLYFSSDRPGTLGGMDLYVSTRSGDEWSEPVNLGPEINTPKHDLFPFIHSSGNLFFSSNGREGEGGLDLYSAQFMGESFGNVQNLGTPLNSAADDLGLILDPDGTKGYFTSSRDGGKGKDDIYMFQVQEGLTGTTPEIINAKIIVYDKLTGDLIEGADLRIFENSANGFMSGNGKLFDAVLMPATDGSSALVFKLVRKDADSLGPADKITDGVGEATYPFVGEKTYLILANKNGYEGNEASYTTIGNTGELVIRIPMEKPNAAPPTANCTNLTGIVKNKNTGMIIPNAKIKIKSSCDGSESTIYSDSNGNFSSCLPVGCNYNLLGEKPSYINGVSTVSNTVSSSTPLSTELYLTPSGGSVFRPGQVIVLENIFYDFNKSHIRSGAARELSELLSVMQAYPSLKIEMSSHTDCRGKTSYNRSLSERRAQSAKDYLVSRGIASHRIEARGYGESMPRKDCGSCESCSEEDHQYNRRTEVKVLSIDNGVEVQYGDNAPEIIDRKN